MVCLVAHFTEFTTRQIVREQTIPHGCRIAGTASLMVNACNSGFVGEKNPATSCGIHEFTFRLPLYRLR